MKDWEESRLTGAELNEFFHRLFPHGFAGADVVQEIASEKWENSPLLACFHPSPEQIFKEGLKFHGSIEKLGRSGYEADSTGSELPPHPKPSMDELLTEWKEQPINITEEVTELVALCLWDVFSNNHQVIAADGRSVDIGSFRGASSFLDEYLTSPSRHWDCGDEYRFYMGSIWISRRADLTTVYRMIFRRFRSFGADWEYHFPQYLWWTCRRWGRRLTRRLGRTRHPKLLRTNRRSASDKSNCRESGRNWTISKTRLVARRRMERRHGRCGPIKRYTSAIPKVGRLRT